MKAVLLDGTLPNVLGPQHQILCPGVSCIIILNGIWPEMEELMMK